MQTKHTDSDNKKSKWKKQQNVYKEKQHNRVEKHVRTVRKRQTNPVTAQSSKLFHTSNDHSVKPSTSKDTKHTRHIYACCVRSSSLCDN